MCVSSVSSLCLLNVIFQGSTLSMHDGEEEEWEESEMVMEGIAVSSLCLSFLVDLFQSVFSQSGLSVLCSCLLLCLPSPLRISSVSALFPFSVLPHCLLYFFIVMFSRTNIINTRRRRRRIGRIRDGHGRYCSLFCLSFLVDLFQ
jgi:hypothetical protein